MLAGLCADYGFGGQSLLKDSSHECTSRIGYIGHILRSVSYIMNNIFIKLIVVKLRQAVENADHSDVDELVLMESVGHCQKG